MLGSSLFLRALSCPKCSEALLQSQSLPCDTKATCLILALSSLQWEMGFRVDQMEHIGISLTESQVAEVISNFILKLIIFYSITKWIAHGNGEKMYQKCPKDTNNVLIPSRYLPDFVMASLWVSLKNRFIKRQKCVSRTLRN